MNRNNEKLLIETAIENLKQIKFFYNNLERIANPHHIGLLDRKLHIHAYQTEGGSVSGKVPGWKNFRIEHISDLKILESHFLPEKSFNPQNSHYSKIYTQISTK